MQSAAAWPRAGSALLPARARTQDSSFAARGHGGTVFWGGGFFGPHEFMSRPGHSERPPGRVGVRGSLKKPRIKNMTAPLYQHVLADSVAPRIKTLAADWQLWEFGVGATDIEYDGEYGSERVWIVSGRATIEPNDGSPSFNVGPGDVVYFLSGFQCTWRVHEAPLVQRYGFFGFDGKEIKDAEVTCDVCGCDCYEESYCTCTTMKWTFVLGVSNWMLTRHNSTRTRRTNAGGSQSNDRSKVWEFPFATVSLCGERL